MTLTIQLDDELADRLEERARSERVPVDQLAQQALASFAAEDVGPAPSEEPWTDEKNGRRCHLIDHQIDGDISIEERKELDRLQAELRRFLNRDAPFDLDEARAVHRKLTTGENGKRDSRICGRMV